MPTRDAVDVALLSAAARHGAQPAEARTANRPFDADTWSMAVVTAGAGAG
ncbi:hypothetical protein [Nonomuraea guangzhouensis]|uniref:Uncharacterized protein n=1 Tax=Nonomuraea guangzhouensis TaxID=1291555 RepID=A0ABW4H056_9ACTN|nr:hypothetical protein [Nonomuraea guangzhouensis]